MPYWPPSLIAEMAERRAVIFVGAGVSVAAGQEVGPQMPDWADLLATLSQLLKKKKERNFVRSLIHKKSFLDAAQVIKDGIETADFVAAIRENVPGRLNSNSKIYEHLLKIDPKIILTTNFDEFLEQSFMQLSGGNRAHSVSKYTQNNLLDDLRSPMRIIGKIHGCITEPGDIVLTRHSYFEAKRRHQTYFSIIEAIATISTVIFLGYSFNDPDVLLILENINLRTPAKNKHYALVPKFGYRSLRDAISIAHNIKFIEYPNDRHENFHKAVEELWVGVDEYRNRKKII